MKKLLSLLLSSIVAIFTLTSCGNESLGMGNYTFAKVHVFSSEGGGVCCNVEKWYDAEIGIEVKTDRGALFLSEGTYMLVESYCPICKK